MAEKKYTLRYLPLFYDEFGDKVDYIAKKITERREDNGGPQVSL